MVQRQYNIFIVYSPSTTITYSHTIFFCFTTRQTYSTVRGRRGALNSVGKKSNSNDHQSATAAIKSKNLSVEWALVNLCVSGCAEASTLLWSSTEFSCVFKYIKLHLKNKCWTEVEGSWISKYGLWASWVTEETINYSTITLILFPSFDSFKLFLPKQK